MIQFQSNKTVAMGEAMIEMAETGSGTYRKGFAGDTFNTAWHMAQIPGLNLPVRFVTKVGTDSLSAEFIAGLGADGLDTSYIGRVADRVMGLYMIELDGAERSFHYWREASAARLLAEDEVWLGQSVQGAGLIHVSGITLAILRPDARARLSSVLACARRQGAIVSFDPNVRPRLWSSSVETRDAMQAMLAVTDIALPSYDDEAALWGDGSPGETIERYRAADVSEIVVKNGAAPVTVWDGAQITEVPCAPVTGIRDTSGAGDAFNAGYLAARLTGHRPDHAIVSGQVLSAAVLHHFGARIPSGQVPSLDIPPPHVDER
ncbi:2-dehydro-3-deoxygluconokinase [Rubricella aquisinus]|uniref:2-dehydro-3-deoxygluconokinase n=1 Tax=Rubricella aquisinus TaxID=2028108 RepID=A0A840WVZ2_9RHOB|nr:sugar kinase [Rubricella aquisinus]MBB5515360.1 2-dehydro-3-deoxygluconokinase [Rubricella aquisinus]